MTTTTQNPKTEKIEPRISPCSCKHEHQDAQFGKGQRYWAHQPKKKRMTCSVCGAQKTV